MPRKRKRKWWTGLRLKPFGYSRHTALHAFEDEVIARRMRQLYEMREMTWTTPNQLANAFPGTFHGRNLHRAMKRMAKSQMLKQSHRLVWRGQKSYALPEVVARGQRKAA